MDTNSNKMDKDIEIRGLSGLSNIGNTCYMNSALQCLSASNLFVSFLIKKRFVSDLKQNIIDEKIYMNKRLPNPL